MKKIIALVLTFLLLLGAATPSVFASEETGEKLPIIYIRGNGEPIYDAQGNTIATGPTDLIMGAFGGDNLELEAAIDAVVNITLPLLTEGLLCDKWDTYGRNVYEELYPIFKGSELDENGNAKYSTGISPQRIAASEAEAKRDTVNYGLFDYNFMYDWRLSPYDHVDRLHEYVLTVLDTTQKPQVCIFASCLGGGLLNAYLERYGHLGLVKNVMFKESLANEATVISEAFSGQIAFDGKHIERYLAQMKYCSEMGLPGGFAFSDILNEIIFKTIDLFNQTNVTDTVLGEVEELYARLYEALVPALCHATGFATQANYWTCVSAEDFDTALNLIFGKEGSETRTKYAGLVEKIVYYYNHCSSQLPELYKKCKYEYNIHIGFIARYGYMNPPITPGVNKLSDFLVSLDAATMGATCAEIGKTLDDEYIAQRIAQGKGEYISPDRQVDLSTALFPDTTWVIKNIHHSYTQLGNEVLLDFLHSTNYTIHSEGAQPQFRVCFEKDVKIEKMTEENCQDLPWISLPEENPTVSTAMAALIRFFTMILNLLTRLING